MINHKQEFARPGKGYGKAHPFMSNSNKNRRQFFSYLANLLGALTALGLAIPAVAYFLAPLRRKRGEDSSGATFHDVGPLSDFPVGEWCLRALEMVQEDGWKKTRVRRSVWVRRVGKGDREFTVLAPICPHLGCPINWHPDQSQFVCPCHGGIFDSNGRHITGPPPRSMDGLDMEVRGGRLWVRWQDFKIGLRERVPINV